MSVVINGLDSCWFTLLHGLPPRGLLNPMANLYKDAFAEPPWNEEWTFDAALEALTPQCTAGVTACAVKDGVLAGFAVALPLEAYGDQTLADYVTPLQEERKCILYVSEVATAKEFRRHHVASQMMLLLEDHALRRFSRIAIRTARENFAMRRVITRLGYNPHGTLTSTTGGKTSEREVFLKHVESGDIRWRHG